MVAPWNVDSDFSKSLGINYGRDYSRMGNMGGSIFNQPDTGPSWRDMLDSGTLDKGPMFGSYGWAGGDSGKGDSQWGNIFKALESSNAWKNQQQQSGYQGGWAQPFARGSGANYQPLGKGKGIHTFHHAPIAGVIHHPRKQKSRGLLGTLGGIATGLAGAGVLGPWGMVAGMGAQALDS